MANYRRCYYCSDAFSGGGITHIGRVYCSKRCVCEDNGLDPAYVQVLEPEPKKSSGCFITTAVCAYLDRPDDGPELTTLRRFRDTYMLQDDVRRSLVARYYEVAPALVRSIDDHPERDGIYRTLLEAFIAPAVSAADAGDPAEAERRYTAMMAWLGERVGPAGA